MRRLLSLVTAVVTGFAGTHCLAADAESVDTAIAKAVGNIYSQQNEGQPHWEWATPTPYPEGEVKVEFDVHREGQWGGRTALALYALLAAGEQPTDPRLAPSIDWLLQQDVRGTYACGTRLLACTYLPLNDEVKDAVRRDATTLLNGVITRGLASGHWDYVNGWIRPDGDTFRYSHSRSQYGLLGLDAAARMGYDIPMPVWQGTDAGWRRNQRSDAGWGYQHPNSYKPEPTTPGMTAAGVASLFLTQRHLLGEPATRGNVIDQNLAGGLAFLAINDDKWATDETYDRDFPMATIYAVERVGVASGLRSIGGEDWYDKGVDWLLASQLSTGSWKSDASESGSLGSTCFGLLFLARGSSPVVVQKLAHGDMEAGMQAAKQLYRQMGAPAVEPDADLAALLAGDWHQRPLDVSGLVDFLGRANEQELHWQIVTADRPLQDWLNSPMLTLAGSRPLRLGDTTKAKLRDYVRNGGLVYFNADGGSRAFAQSVRQLGTELFPDQQWQVVSDDSPIVRGRFNATAVGGNVPNLLQIGNGVRPFFVLADKADLAAAWQRQQTDDDKPTDTVALQIGANLLAGTLDPDSLPRKGSRVQLTADDAEISAIAKVGIVRTVEPDAWRRVAVTAALEDGYGIELADASLTDTDLQNYDLIVLAGVGPLELSPQEQAALTAYIDNGGTLLLEATGGDSAFATAADAYLAEAFGSTEPLSKDHPLLGEPFDVSWKLEAKKKLGGSAVGVRLRGVERDGRVIVVFSPDDLSAAAAGSRWPMVGYDPASARRLMVRIAAYAARD